jgi:hypothetical protein
MTTSKNDALRRKLELLRKTSEIDLLLEKGDVEEQALQSSAVDAQPTEESHILDLMENPMVEAEGRKPRPINSRKISRAKPKREMESKSARARTKPRAQKTRKAVRVAQSKKKRRK